MWMITMKPDMGKVPIMMSLSMMKRSRQEQLILLRPTAGFLTKMSRYRKTILTNLIRNPRLRIRIIRSRNRQLSPIRSRDIRSPGLNGLIRKAGITRRRMDSRIIKKRLLTRKRQIPMPKKAFPENRLRKTGRAQP